MVFSEKCTHFLPEGFTNAAKKGTLRGERKWGRMPEKRRVLLRLFWQSLVISAFTFGGGYVIVTLMKKKFVDEAHWLSEQEMLDLAAIAQSAPGPVAVNGAVAVGYRLAGFAGAAAAALGTVLPPFVIITAISWCYDAFRSNAAAGLVLGGMQAGVAAVIASVVWDMGAPAVREKDAASIAVMAAAFCASCVFHVNVVYIILACLALGAARTLRMRRRNGK